MPERSKIPDPSLARLATVYRALLDSQRNGRKSLNSLDLQELTGIAATQIRKDLSHLGEMGKPGVGYDIGDLKRRIAERLNLSRSQKFAIIGAGRLGQALASYPGLAEFSFKLAALFDVDKKKIGKVVNGVAIQPANEISKNLRRHRVRIAVLTVPASAAQGAAEAAVQGGARWILNFTPAHIAVPAGCVVRNVSFTNEFAVLAHFVEK
jgi:redox-sensing transcriptional repressor